jgi:hypothetical protein
VAEVIGARAQTPLVIPPDTPSIESKPCPRCNRPLALFSYPGTLTIIDACRNCHGVWLDAGEIQEIQAAREKKSMTCPKCGKVQSVAETCSSCGVVVEKARRVRPDAAARPLPPRHLPSSADSGGLKQSLLVFVDQMLSSLWAGIRE